MGDNVKIIGGKGMLGTDLASLLQSRGIQPLILDLPEFDIANPDHLKNSVCENDTVINCAAYTNVEKAEQEFQLANKINGHAVGDLGKIAKQKNAWLLHISTDFVFDGNLDRPYNETDTTNPINAYGKSKLLGEELLARSQCRHAILRLQWTYGQNGTNFVKKLIQLANERDEIKVVDDQVGSPTWTIEAANAICSMIDKKPNGTFHFACSGCTSRYDMANFIIAKTNSKARVIPCKSDEFPSAAKRPSNSRFDCTKIAGLLDEPVNTWQDCLADFLEQL